MADVTRILACLEVGDPAAAEQLLPLVYGELRRLNVRGGGFIDAVVANAASTRAQSTFIDVQTSIFGNSQTVKRQQYNVDHYDTLNLIGFSFANPSRLSYTAGRGGDVTFVRGTLANVPVIVNGGAAPDVFWIEGDQAPLLAPVTVIGNSTEGDYAYYYDYAAATPQNYTFTVDNGTQVVSRSGAANVSYSGLTQLIHYTGLYGGNHVAVQSVASGLFLNMVVAQDDVVTLGNSGGMSTILGPVSVAGGAGATNFRGQGDSDFFFANVGDATDWTEGERRVTV